MAAISAEVLKQASLQTERATMAFNTGMSEYQDACRRCDWQILDDKRFQTITALEGLLDCYASVHRLMGNGF
jgi:hypothetical protein